MQMVKCAPSPIAGHPGAAIAAALHALLDGHRKGTWLVSLAHTVLAIRQQVPDCDLSDGDLADMVAIHAVERGHIIAFDADLLPHL